MSTAHGAERIPWTTGRVQGSPLPPPPYIAERLFPSISFQQPVDFSVAPGSRRLFVAEQSGRLWSFELDSPRPPDLAIDLRRHHQPFDSILAFTFHPGFATNRFVFINYNEPGGRANGSHVSRFTVSFVATNAGAARPVPTIDPASEHVVLRWFSGGHNGCTLAFGPDGFLYISTGDGAAPDPPDGEFKTGQDNRDLLASILRIDVDHTSGTNAYAIPTDNPFIQRPDARPEIWAFGFRNPFRMAFDPVAGDLWVGDVGWEQWEMVHRVERGGNYGWAITEGPNRHVRDDIAPGPTPILPPVVALPHSEAASITGGTVYHGKKLPGLRGAYVYGDWETGKFWALRHQSGRRTVNDELCDTVLKPTAFALDPNGELLILDYNGGIYGLIPNDARQSNVPFPRRLSDTGLFAETRPLRPAAGTQPYRIAAPRWNDHATAQWLLAVPGRDSIITSDGVGNIAGATWSFPTNTVLARTLNLEFSAGEPATARPVETQLLHWDGQAWNPYTYRWRADGADADLIGPAGTNDVFTVRDPDAPGGQRVIPWRYMTRAECLRCHNAWAGEALTLNWLQLGSPDAPASQLRQLAGQGLLRLQRAPSTAQTLAYPYDESFPLEDRARSWLHVNCAPCHRFGAGGAVAIHLDYDKNPRDMRALDLKPLRGDFGLIGARIIASGDPFRSTLFYRIHTEGAGRMPHIGSRLVDPDGVALMRDWIQSLRRPAAAPGQPDEPAIAALSADIIRHRAALAGPDRTAAAGALLASVNGSLALLDAIDAAPELRPLAARAGQHTNLLVRDLFQRLVPAGQRRLTLGTDPDPASILALTGDAVRGQALFTGAAQCVQCHPYAGGGRAFGPDLTRLPRPYDRAQLLEQILFPSRFIAPEFRPVTIITRDGRELNGFVIQRDAGEMVVKDQELTEHRVRVADVVDRRESALSAMPEGLLAPLTAQEAADLLEFLLVKKIH